MSREDHPSYPSCCTPFVRIAPGHIKRFHANWCKVAPGKLMEPNRAEVLTTRAEVASAAERYADTVATGHDPDCGCDDCLFEMYWRDPAYEQREGK